MCCGFQHKKLLIARHFKRTVSQYTQNLLTKRAHKEKLGEKRNSRLRPNKKNTA